ncbi:MAG: OmpA family protein [Chitinophagaceae bacterium]
MLEFHDFCFPVGTGKLLIALIGHTDSDGSDATNLKLSKRRAEAVKAALAKDWNIDASAMQTDGKGEGSPAGDNKTRESKRRTAESNL